jgi:hypothetical protein
MQSFGEHLQLSVFPVRSHSFDCIEMQVGSGRDHHNHEEDKVLIINLGRTDPFLVKNIQALGKQVKVVTRAAVIS